MHNLSDLPSWFQDGLKLHDVFARAPDAVLLQEWELDEDPEDWHSLDWRECLIPVSTFGMNYTTLDGYLRALPSFMSMESEMTRIDDIEAWVAECCGIEQALLDCPIVVRLTNTGNLKIEDGYHRLGVTAATYRKEHIRAVCAQW